MNRGRQFTLPGRHTKKARLEIAPDRKRSHPEASDYPSRDGEGGEHFFGSLLQVDQNSSPSVLRVSLKVRQPLIMELMIDCRDMMSSRTATYT